MNHQHLREAMPNTEHRGWNIEVGLYHIYSSLDPRWLKAVHLISCQGFYAQSWDFYTLSCQLWLGKHGCMATVKQFIDQYYKTKTKTQTDGAVAVHYPTQQQSGDLQPGPFQV